MAQYFLILLLVCAFIGMLSWFLLPEPWSRILLLAGRQGARLRSIDVNVGELRWHVLRGGAGTPLVAIHGFGGDGDHWQRVAIRLVTRFEIIAPDLIGFGSSHPGDSLAYTIDDQVSRLAMLLDRLGIDSCIMAGSSMGGWIASRFAQRYPDRVMGLWLLAPLGVRDCVRGELLTNIETHHDNPLHVESTGDFEDRVFRPMFTRPPYLPRPLRVHYGRRAVERSQASQRMFAQVHGSEPVLEEIICDLDIPILIQWGADDRAVHISGAERLRRVIDCGQVIVQENVGHLPMLEAPRLTAAQFIQFAEAQGLTSPKQA